MIFFLDIDGVLVTPRAMTSFSRSVGPYTGLDPICVNLFNKWVKQAEEFQEVHLVMSSAWRMGQTTIGMYQVLATMGVDCNLHRDWSTGLQNGRERGVVVQEWLDKHPKEKYWIIIDDCTDFFPFQKERMIHTHLYDGITLDTFLKGQQLIRNMLCSQ